MKIIIISNAFKGSRTSMDVASDIEKGILRVDPDAEIIKLSAADGGDGTLDTLINAVGGYKKTAIVKDPLDRDIEAEYGILDNGKGVIEMSLVSGLTLLKKSERNPMLTSSYGTGQLILKLLDEDIGDIIVGIGGSATNDGGTGMAEALGAKFYNQKGELLHMCGGNLDDICDVDLSEMDMRLGDCKITVACDVTNTLIGRDGASYVYAPQKGATPAQVKLLDQGLYNLNLIMQANTGLDNSLVSGAGAAGGMGYGMMTFLHAKLLPGVETMLDAVNFDDYLDGTDIIFTGEGRIDFQSAFGKVPAGVAVRAKALRIPVVAIAGIIGKGAEKLYEQGVTSIFSIAEGPIAVETSIKKAPTLIANTAERIMRLWEAARDIYNW
jgi:glycerate kinase